MSRKQRERWSETRARGKADYVLKVGVLSYGLPMFLIMSLIVHRDRLDANSVVLSGLLWILGGVIYGIATWHISEARFNAKPDPERG